MEIRFYSFSKRVNSTAIPTGTASGTYQIQLKDDTSLMNPTIIMRKSDYIFSWNYAYIPVFDRYYRVGDPRIAAGHMIEIPLSEDVLASNKSDILSQNAYIEYCADSTEVYINDNRLTALTSAVPSVVSATPTYLSSSEFIYVLHCIGTAESLTPDIISPYTLTYVVSQSAMWSLARKLYNDFTTNILDDLAKYFSDASNCVVSIEKLPMSLAAVQGDKIARPIYLGKYDSGVNGVPFNDTTLSETVEITIPWASNDFRRNEPFTSMRLYLPYVGIVDVSPVDFIYSNKMYIDIHYSLMNRQINYLIRSTSANKIAVYSGQMGYSIPSSTYQSNVGGVMTAALNTVGTVAGIATGTEALTVATAIGAVTNMTGALQKTASMTGNFNGSGMEKLGNNPTLITTYHNTVDTPDSYKDLLGRPYCKISTIGSHSGYIKCANASISIAVNEGELEEINTLLNTGVFIE